MALRITKKQEMFEIKGKIINKNALAIKRYFDRLLPKSEKIVINLNHVEKIDAFGVRIFNQLFENAMKANTVFYIMTKKNNDIMEAFGKANYILKNDVS